jgi:DNA polymerase-3 subunit chi
VTSIDFYTHVADRLLVTARLVAKAYAQHGSVRVLAPDAATADAVSRHLWTVNAVGFLPHCRLSSALAAETPILVDERLEHVGPAAVLINLHPSPPPFFSRFERLAEIVGLDDAEAARVRFRFYRERGYPLRTHKLGEN